MKKKSILTLLYFVFLTFYSFSQVNILYNDGVNTLANDIAKYNNNTYFYTSFDGYYTKLKRITNNGTIINEITLNNTNTQIQPAKNKCLIIKNNKTYFLNNETFYGDTTKYFLSLTCFDINLDTIWNKKYFVDTTKIIINSITNTNDDGFAFGGNISKNDEYNNCILIKTDSLGNMQWYNEYGFNNIYDKTTNIIQTQDSGYIISGSTEKYGKTDWYIVRTDSVGNQIWDWVLHNPQNLSDGAVADLIQTQDGNFVAVGGQTYTCNSYCFYNSRLLKFDINKNILLDTLYYEEYGNQNHKNDSTLSAFGKIKEKTNGNFIIINYHQARPGSHAATTTNMYELYNDFSVKIKREFRSTSKKVIVNDYIKDFIIEDDGSLTMIGDNNNTYDTAPYQRVWFVKTDTNYCDDFGSCDTLQGIIFYTPDSISKNDTININFEIQSNFNTNYNVNIIFYNTELLDIMYKKYYNVPVNDIRNLNISYNNLTDSALFGNNVTDTLYIYYELLPSDSVSRGTFRSNIRDNYIVFYQPEVGIKEITKPRARINVYPNPAKNTLFLEIKNKKLKINDDNKNKVFIYDIYGRVVKQFKIQNSKFKINVSDLEKGVYFVKVGGAVGKFVKE